MGSPIPGKLWAYHVTEAARFFSTRYCETEKSSIAELERIACSRFTEDVRALHLDFRLVCHKLDFERHFLDDLDHSLDPCVGIQIEPKSLIEKLNIIFKRMKNLSEFLICGPAPIAGMGHGQFTLNPWPTNDSGKHAVFAPIYENFLAHYHVVNFEILETIVPRILDALHVRDRGLDKFSLVGFSTYSWQEMLIPSAPTLGCVLSLPSIQSLTRLELELAMLEEASLGSIACVARIIEHTPQLQHLKVHAGPTDLTFSTSHEEYSPLLEVLGINPPFRLQSLDLEGVITGSKITLDDIVRVHTTTLRRMVLNHVNLHAPNYIRVLFKSLAVADLDYFAVRNMWCHNRFWLCPSTLQTTMKPDEVLSHYVADEDDASAAYVGFVYISLEVYKHTKWIIHDATAKNHGKVWMRRSLLSVVEQVDCGGIRDA